MMHTLPVIKVELSVEVSFETFGQVYYTDENGRSWIKEAQAQVQARW
jgi:phage pi2 protein 07